MASCYVHQLHGQADYATKFVNQLIETVEKVDALQLYSNPPCSSYYGESK